MPIGTVILIVALIIGRRHRMATRQVSTMKSAAIFILIVAAISLIAVAAAERYGADAAEAQRLAPSAATAARALEELDERRREPEFRWLAALVFSGVLVGVVAASVLAGLWKRRLDRDPERLAAEALADELDLTVDDLRREPDLRRAVVAAYARMERSLALHGLPRRRFEAPLEYLARVLRELHVTPAAAFALTVLFEQAKFSRHAIDAEMKAEAIDALRTIQGEVRELC